MYYRRKILLALLQILGGRLEKIRFQKLLFLFSKEQEKQDYHFIPFKYGCFSYQANQDMNLLSNQNIIKEIENEWVFVSKDNFFAMLKEKDKIIIRYIKSEYQNIPKDDLIKYTYIKYPYFAINSTIAKKILSTEDYNKVLNIKPTSNKIKLYTIGYEGISLEEYINKLLKYDIKLLIDVRNNPISMKYGFSKNFLKSVCNAVNIEYLHFPEVGIQSEHRQTLQTQNDYDILFEKYKNESLTNTIQTQEKILNLLIDYQRIALTCFEANICQCHRKHLAEAITIQEKWQYELIHI